MKRSCLHYIMAASFGTISEPTAIAVLEQESRDVPDHGLENRELRLRHLERFSLDTKYPAIIDRVHDLLRILDEKDEAKPPKLLVDVTATGKRIVELMRKKELHPTSVLVSMGTGQTERGWYDYRVSKLELIGSMQVSYSEDVLKVAAGLELAPTLVQELQSFKLKQPPLNTSDAEAWRERPHDDLVIATALACWWAVDHVPKPPSIRGRQNRRMKEHYRQLDRARV